jgi:predicted outer membrane repeat protein
MVVPHPENRREFRAPTNEIGISPMKSTSKAIAQATVFVVCVVAMSHAVASNGVVSSPNCNETGFNTVLTNVQNTGGGTITFNCAVPTTITFSSHTTRQISQNVTIDGAGKITLDGAGSNNFFQVFSGKSFTLKNITLQHGALDGGVHALESFGNLVLSHATITSNSSKGSAILINSGSLTVASSTFSGNIIQNVSGHDAGGAAIRVAASAVVGISDSTFSGNIVKGDPSPDGISGNGGAIAFGDGTLNVTRTTFSGNKALDGGAIQLAAGSALIEHSTFASNQAGYGGAIEDDGATFDVKTSTFSTNTAANDGGAIWLLFGSASSVSSVDQSQFTGNKATSSGGGAISCYAGANNALDVLNSSFSGNQSMGGHGGAIYAGCQFYTENSTYYNNTAGASSGGGGLFHTGDSPFSAYRVTITQNKALYGAGIANSSSGAYLPNIGYSIVSANMTTEAIPVVNNCSGAFPFPNNPGYNLSDGTTCGGAFSNPTTDKVNANLPMQAYGNHGGPTLTLPPASGNDAINFIPSSIYCPTPNVGLKDQRGALRPAPDSSACDSGAFEVNGIIDEIFKDGFEAF